ncbi:MAG: TfoX/Sxy family protein [Alphaproteobacteria bacterium]|jgi:DNA transformation protein|nr:TfoX/Sxy family protein [Alphaproteobacteria bacterium]MDP6567635.1 TfoX/Sxy family protein [Alphaproteobacteria bacterium]MDP6812584.1 TfoX/Sxy family protein [Alphaproteobacteria bacterium]
MAVSPEYRAYVEDLLEPLGHVTSRRMFGGVGIFYRGLMFALVSADAIYFKVDDGNRPDYEAAGMAPFSYQRNGRRAALTSYWRVPDDILDVEDEILDWARGAADAALRADAAKGAKGRK